MDGLGHPEALEGRRLGGDRLKAHGDRLAGERREEEELELGVAPVEPGPDARQPRRGLALQSGEQPQAERDRREELAIEPGPVEQLIVDPDAHQDAVRSRLEMQLARPVAGGPEKEREHLADAGEIHDRAVRAVGSAVDRLVRGSVVPPREGRDSGNARSKWSTASWRPARR
jgi:hypothetical protein